MVDRFFLPEGFDGSQVRVELEEHERDHALQSRRIREGDIVELLNGSGWVARGRVRLATRKCFEVELEHVEQRQREGREVHLAVCVPRGTRMDSLVDGATQMGIASLCPVVAERAVSAREDLSENRIDRWRRIAREAAKQSGEPFVPDLAPPIRLAELLTAPFSGARLLLHPGAEAAGFVSSLTPDTRTVRVLVGPEGGFTADEVRLAEANGEVKVKLGRSILRIEMAALAAAVLARYAALARYGGTPDR